MIKLFVSDLDGTLLNVDHHVSKETYDAVHKLRKAGVSFMPASGRDYDALMLVMKELDIKPKCICLNGAQSYDNDGTLQKYFTIDKDVCRYVANLVDTYKLDVDFYTSNGRYNYGDIEYFPELLKARFQCLFHDDNREHIQQFIKESKTIENTKVTADFESILEYDVLKIEMYFSNSVQRNMVFKMIRKLKGISACGSHDLNLEITSSEATKGNMVKTVMESRGFNEDEVVVIGDGFNDSSMFQLFTNSFCMGQASDELKKLATYDVPSNKENGVAYVINHLLANNLEINEDTIESFKK